MSMVRAVADVLRRHQEIWSSLPRFSVYGSNLFDLIKEVDAAQVRTDTVATGATLDKARAGEEALHLGGNLSRRAQAYAEDRHLYELRNQLKIKRHELLHGHDAEILHKLRDLQSQLEALLLQLSDYGIDEPRLAAFTAAIDRYESLLAHPRDVVVERKSQNQFLAAYLKVVRRQLLVMDHLVNVFEGTPFEYEYHNARIMVSVGTRHRPPADGSSATGTAL